jgi:PEP-CTERM motif-containing protein
VDQRFSVVPEPGSLVLLSSGLMGLFAFGRKRKS